MRRVAAVLGTMLAFGLGGCGPRPHVEQVTAPDWPQPVDGRLTAAMCGLLVPADLHASVDPVPAPPRLDVDDLACQLGQLHYTLDLQPNAESAGLLLDQRRKSAVTVPDPGPQIVRDEVDGAQDSMRIDRAGGSDLVLARRGALLVTLQCHDCGVEAAALPDLAAAILRRSPDTGATDTGPTRTLRYDVEGFGATVDHLRYRDPLGLDNDEMELKNVQLPYTSSLRYVTVGSQTQISAYVEAWNDAGDAAGRPLGCTLTIDGAVRASASSTGALVHCEVGG
jgi:hypothetical protein